jgi:L-iditol 2-dehydrogenase
VNTVLKAVKLLNLAADETVLVIGQGPIGMMLAALSRRTGARVLTSDLYPERHAIAAKFGLHEPIDAGRECGRAHFGRNRGRGADAVILAVGGKALIQTAMDAVRPGGKVMLFAQTQHERPASTPARFAWTRRPCSVPTLLSTAIQPEVKSWSLGGYRNGFRSDATDLAPLSAGRGGGGH